MVANGSRVALLTGHQAYDLRHAPAAGDRKRGDSGTDGSQTLPWRERIRTIGTAGEGPDASCVGSLSLRLFG